VLSKFWFEIKKLYRRIRSVFVPVSAVPLISDSQASIDIINDKIKLLKGTNKNSIKSDAYQKYFDFLEKLGLREEFIITTTQDNLTLRGVSIQPILINDNNEKVVIFCHGVTNNRWSLFYTMHLALQRGYRIVSYDARNHGLSDKFSTSLGQTEACDLQDVINWVKERYEPIKIGLYGFSMGAATCLFWISFFGGAGNSEVAFAICEAPYGNVAEGIKEALGSGINYYWKEFFLTKIITEKLHSTREKLEKISPYLALPQQLPIKLLLVHGLQDVVINWRASFKLWYQLRKSEENKDKINLYFFRHADHGEVPFIGDYVPNSTRWKTRKRSSQYTFSGLFCNYLQKNL